MAVGDVKNEQHIGDGLYVSFDGFQFKLRAPREHGDHEVYLEPSVLIEFEKYVNETYKHYNVKRPGT